MAGRAAARRRLTAPACPSTGELCYNRRINIPLQSRSMRLLPFLRWFGVAALVAVLTACGGAKKEAYVEKPVDDLYNKAMDELVEERYPTAAKTFEEGESQHPYSVWATKSQLMSAYAQYEAENYGEAIIATHPFIHLPPAHLAIPHATNFNPYSH